MAVQDLGASQFHFDNARFTHDELKNDRTSPTGCRAAAGKQGKQPSLRHSSDPQAAWAKLARVVLYYSERPSWLRLVFSIRGSDLPRIRYRLLAVLAQSILLTWLHERGPLNSPLTPPILSIMGLALGIFLGFRNNTSYDRYWEGRKLWGALVNTSRAWARDVLTLVDGSPDQVGPSPFQTAQVRRIVGYAHALRLALRKQDHTEELSRWLSPEELSVVNKRSNAPDAILQILARENQRAHQLGLITDYRLVRLAELLNAFTDIAGGCERIRNTPIPHSYTILMHRIVALYVFALPFGLVNSLHFVTPLVVLLVAYTFLGLDAVGDELEDPFGEDLNDLPLSTLCRTIEINLLEALGETNVPAPYPAERGFLS